MYKNFKPIRNKSGKIIKDAPYQGWNSSGTQARVEPNRKWFGNTRVITQNALQTFQDEMNKVKNDPYKLIMKPTNLPTTILNEKAKVCYFD
jgi:nuclear GTP-binding protein